MLNSNTSSTCTDNMVNFGQLTAEICWRVRGTPVPCSFQRVSRLGSVTARHSSSARRPNFAALNRGRHLYSSGRPSRLALAHILVSFCPKRHECTCAHLRGVSHAAEYCVAWWSNAWLGHWLWIERSRVQLQAVPLSGNDMCLCHQAV